MNKTKDVLVPMSPEIYEIWKKGLGVTINDLEKELIKSKDKYYVLEQKINIQENFINVLKNVLKNKFPKNPSIIINVDSVRRSVFSSGTAIQFDYFSYIKGITFSIYNGNFNFSERFLVDYINADIRYKSLKYLNAVEKLNKVKEEIIKEKKLLEVQKEQLKIERNKKNYFSFKNLFK